MWAGSNVDRARCLSSFLQGLPAVLPAARHQPMARIGPGVGCWPVVKFDRVAGQPALLPAPYRAPFYVSPSFRRESCWPFTHGHFHGPTDPHPHVNPPTDPRARLRSCTDPLISSKLARHRRCPRPQHTPLHETTKAPGAPRSYLARLSARWGACAGVGV